jgi:hypothetical protein
MRAQVGFGALDNILPPRDDVPMALTGARSACHGWHDTSEPNARELADLSDWTGKTDSGRVGFCQIGRLNRLAVRGY